MEDDDDDDEGEETDASVAQTPSIVALDDAPFDTLFLQTSSTSWLHNNAANRKRDAAIVAKSSKPDGEKVAIFYFAAPVPAAHYRSGVLCYEKKPGYVELKKVKNADDQVGNPISKTALKKIVRERAFVNTLLLQSRFIVARDYDANTGLFRDVDEELQRRLPIFLLVDNLWHPVDVIYNYAMLLSQRGGRSIFMRHAHVVVEELPETAADEMVVTELAKLASKPVDPRDMTRRFADADTDIVFTEPMQKLRESLANRFVTDEQEIEALGDKVSTFYDEESFVLAVLDYLNFKLRAQTESQ